MWYILSFHFKRNEIGTSYLTEPFDTFWKCHFLSLQIPRNSWKDSVGWVLGSSSNGGVGSSIGGVLGMAVLGWVLEAFMYYWMIKAIKKVSVCPHFYVFSTKLYLMSCSCRLRRLLEPNSGGTCYTYPLFFSTVSLLVAPCHDIRWLFLVGQLLHACYLYNR